MVEPRRVRFWSGGVALAGPAAWRWRVRWRGVGGPVAVSG